MLDQEGRLQDLRSLAVTAGHHVRDAQVVERLVVVWADLEGEVVEQLGFIVTAQLIHRDPQRGEREGRFGIEKAGDEATSMNNLGYVYFLNGRYAEALEHFERALLLGATDYLTVLRNLSMARKSHRENLEGQFLPSLGGEGTPDV